MMRAALFLAFAAFVSAPAHALDLHKFNALASGPITAAKAEALREDQCDPIRTAAMFAGSWEGRRNHAYLDRIAWPHVPTICDGWTIGVRMGDYMTDAECDALMEREVPRYRDAARAHMTETTKAERMTCLRDVSTTSLVWNIGTGAYGRSTSLRRLNAGDVRGACEAASWWNRAGGKKVFGLERRRMAERALCLRGVA